MDRSSRVRRRVRHVMPKSSGQTGRRFEVVDGASELWQRDGQPNGFENGFHFSRSPTFASGRTFAGSFSNCFDRALGEAPAGLAARPGGTSTRIRLRSAFRHRAATLCVHFELRDAPFGGVLPPGCRSFSGWRSCTCRCDCCRSRLRSAFGDPERGLRGRIRASLRHIAAACRAAIAKRATCLILYPSSEPIGSQRRGTRFFSF